MTPSEVIALGFAVVPVAHPLPDGTCSCRLRGDCPSPGKHPVGRGWLKSAVSRRARLGERYRAPANVELAPRMSYGLVPMPGSGMMVIDRDDPSVGLPMPETFEVHRASADPRKGHYYFRLADGIREADVPRAFAGGEVRVAGSGHVVGPGCRHASGDLYEPSGEAIGTADRELVDALSALPPVRRTAEGAVEAVEGSRHAWLVGQARKLAGWGHDSGQIADELEALNQEYCVPPLTDKEAEFGRMAEWAARNIAPDAALVITHGTKANPWGIR